MLAPRINTNREGLALRIVSLLVVFLSILWLLAGSQGVRVSDMDLFGVASDSVSGTLAEILVEYLSGYEGVTDIFTSHFINSFALRAIDRVWCRVDTSRLGDRGGRRDDRFAQDNGRHSDPLATLALHRLAGNFRLGLVVLAATGANDRNDARIRSITSKQCDATFALQHASDVRFIEFVTRVTGGTLAITCHLSGAP